MRLKLEIEHLALRNRPRDLEIAHECSVVGTTLGLDPILGSSSSLSLLCGSTQVCASYEGQT